MKKVNYARIPTEKPNPRSKKIDRLSIPEIIEMMNQEDRKVPEAVRRVKRNIAQAAELIVAAIRGGGKLYLAGAGTSGRLAVIEAAECPPTFGTPPSLVQAVMAGGKQSVFYSKEGAEDRLNESLKIFRKKLNSSDVLIGIAASGVTPFVRGALQAAREKKAHSILISCDSSSPMKGLAHCLIAPKVGPEVITGSTRLKAGTATKLVLNMLTVASMVKLGKVYENWMVDLQPKSDKLRSRALRLIQRLGGVPINEAREYLVEARNNVKLAILMAKSHYSYEVAAVKLKKASGFLRDAFRR